MCWQADLVDRVVGAATTGKAIGEVWLVGSLAVAADLDRWSDVDLGLVLTADLTVPELLDEPAEVWAVDQHDSPAGQTVRLVLDDGRRVDVLVAAAEELSARVGARRIWVGGARYQPRARLVVAAPTDPTAGEIRFLLALAAAKLGRGDQLIGGHLTLEVARICLVQGMLLRDRDEDQTSHRYGTARDQVALPVWAALGEPLGAETLRTLAAEFDRLHSELEPDYRPDWSGLEALLGL